MNLTGFFFSTLYFYIGFLVRGPILTVTAAEIIVVSHRTGKPVEICFFPVPNIEEVQFGTALNKAFGTEVAKDLGMGDYKPGSTIRTYLVQYSNIYWAKKARGGGATICFVLKLLLLLLVVVVVV